MNTFEQYNIPTQYTQAPINLETADAGIKNLATSMGGNIAGGVFNTVMNGILQQHQFEEQEKLQRNAYRLNEKAVQNQAELQAIGMQNAGLNPAQVQGNGAPSIQAGAAAGSTSTMGNIFTGIADIITAAKMPSEIMRNEAESVQRSAESARIPTEIKRFQEEANKFAEQARGLKNENDFMEAHNKFLKEQAPTIFQNYIDQLKASGVWDNLPLKTRETWENMANSDFEEEGIGLIRGINDMINTNKNLSDADREVLGNTKQMIIDFYQIMDQKTMRAFADMPKWQQKLMKSEITEFYARAGQEKATADWTNTKKWLDEHTSDQWLIEHGMSDEIERKKYTELMNRLMNFPFDFMNGMGPAMLIRSGMPGKTKIPYEPTYDTDKGNIFKGGLRGWQEGGPMTTNSPWR